MGTRSAPRRAASRGPRGPSVRLGPVLDDFIVRADVSQALSVDPLALAHEAAPREREVVAFLAASFAFGQVAVLKAALRQVLGALGPSPTDTLRTLELEALHARLAGFYYRWIRARDLARFLAALGEVLRAHGTLERAFLVGHSDGDADVQPGLAAFSRLLREAAGAPLTRGLAFLLPSPDGGSACKRMCLFLRWVVRPADGVDLGLWRGVRPAQLLMPLDTHIARISRYLGLTRRATPGLAMVKDVTAALRRLCPEDPLRYDFALCHLGISGRCPSRRVPGICRECDLNEICLLPGPGR